MKLRASVLCATVALVGLSGCAEFYEPTTRTTRFEPGTALSHTSSLTSIYVRDGKSHYITCTQPPPDTAFDTGESANMAISLISLQGGDSGGESADAEEAEMAGRTPAVLMTRELFFRACEFSQNYGLGKDEALALYQKTLDTVSSGWATEAANTNVTVGDAVNTTTDTSVRSSISGSTSESETSTQTTPTPTPAQ